MSKLHSPINKVKVNQQRPQRCHFDMSCVIPKQIKESKTENCPGGNNANIPKIVEISKKWIVPSCAAGDFTYNLM